VKTIIFLLIAALSANAQVINSPGGGASTSSAIVSLFTGCSGTLYLGADGACHAASGSPAGSSGTVQWNNGGAFGGVTGSLVDNFPDFAGRNSVGIATNNTWTNSDNTHSGHGMEPTVKLQGAGLGNTMAALYATANYNASGGCIHCGPIMGRGTDSGTGGTINELRFSPTSTTTAAEQPTTAVTTLTWLKLAGGCDHEQRFLTEPFCGLCYSLPDSGGGTMPAGYAPRS
jgi:hypothetical protein